MSGAGRKDQGVAEQLNGGLVQQTWSIDDGLPQNSVHAILQTQDGFLWIATEGGLARFDGLNFRVFQQASEPAFTSDDVCCLAEDTRNALWIGTADGLIRESGGRFERFGVKAGLPSSTIQDVVVGNDGSVLVQTTMGVARVDSQGRVVPLGVPGGDSVLAMSRSADGSVWMATANDLLRYEGGELHRERALLTQSVDGSGGSRDGSGPASSVAAIGPGGHTHPEGGTAELESGSRTSGHAYRVDFGRLARSCLDWNESRSCVDRCNERGDEQVGAAGCTHDHEQRSFDDGRS